VTLLSKIWVLEVSAVDFSGEPGTKALTECASRLKRCQPTMASTCVLLSKNLEVHLSAASVLSWVSLRWPKVGVP
jgi:hypothetical protein